MVHTFFQQCLYAAIWTGSVLLVTGCSTNTNTTNQSTQDALSIAETTAQLDVHVDSSELDTGLLDAAQNSDSAGNDGASDDIGAIADTSKPEADSLAADTVDLDQSSTDASAGDSGVTDTVTVDSMAPDTQPAPPLQCGFQVTWKAPVATEIFALGDAVQLQTEAVVPAGLAAAKLMVQWRANGLVLSETPLIGGKSDLSTKKLPQGQVELEAQVITPQGTCVEISKHSVTICGMKIAENFDIKPTNTVWKTYGDAYWDKGGWLEMTGNVKSKQGAFYDVIHNVAPGDASVRFRIATGGGINSGADGYALNFVEAPTISELESIIKTANAGGCLGYGVAGACGNMKIQGFHVEFDTWQNKKDPNQDPSASNHIGIMVDGDASDHKLHVPLSNLEDLKWHDVRVDVVGTKVRVFWDGVKKLEKVVPDLNFRGGRIFVSGSTGWATNFHRLDDLVVLHGCK
ncbi:MAG TPA: hypothetical protein DCQ06_13525 [Myxococcales bacterium]|nr:hypothetical protein [Myxococcales bacterium]HAN32610.1 hypothetical protein [Myxococcales bacterium]